MSDQPTKRPWFQFHLSTAVVLTFVAAGLLWANMCPTNLQIHHNPGDIFVSKQGWPFCCVLRIGPGRPGVVPSTLYGRLVIDVVVAICILLAVAVLCEWLIRRKERRQ